MEILQGCRYKRDGNDCLLNTYVYLVEVDTELYAVTSISEVIGSYFNEAPSAITKIFNKLEEAMEYLDISVTGENVS